MGRWVALCALVLALLAGIGASPAWAGDYVVRDATDLRPGDRIVVQPGRIETVVEPTTVNTSFGVVHTAGRDILAGLPCPVKVLR